MRRVFIAEVRFLALPCFVCDIGDNGLLVTPTPIPGAPVNINTASVDEIIACHCGLGPSLAQAVVDYRTLHLAFKSIDDLTLVPGIGSSILDIIKKDGRLVVLP